MRLHAPGFTTHPLGWLYIVQDSTGQDRDYYQFKKDAVIHARIMQKHDGGEWSVYRSRKNGKLKRLVKVIGGYFDDWPGDDW